MHLKGLKSATHGLGDVRGLRALCWRLSTTGRTFTLKQCHYKVRTARIIHPEPNQSSEIYDAARKDEQSRDQDYSDPPMSEVGKTSGVRKHNPAHKKIRCMDDDALLLQIPGP